MNSENIRTSYHHRLLLFFILKKIKEQRKSEHLL